jgi:hypothetical protein
VVEQIPFFNGPNPKPFDDDHGTCMASYLMGAFSGVAKYTRVKSYKISNPETKNIPPDAMYSAIAAAVRDVATERANGISRFAIINISVESISLLPDPKTGLSTRDAFPDILDLLERNQIFLVYAAGNFAVNQLQNRTPVKWGNSRKYLIVVGLCNSKGLRVPEQTQEGTSDGLSVYAYAHHAMCAIPGTNTYDTKTGTSGATAMVSGMLAIMLKDGVSPDTAKQHLMDVSRSRKPPIASPNQRDGVPRVSFAVEVACPAFPDSPSDPEDSRPVFKIADIPRPVIGSPLVVSVNDVLARVSFARTATSANANLIV